MVDPDRATAAATFGPEQRRALLHHFELRCAVEPEAAALAAERGTTQDFDRLRSVLNRPVIGVGAYRAAHSQFHIGIATACGNPLIHGVVADLCVQFAWTHVAESLRDFDATHRPIYDGLMARDAAESRNRMQAHLTAVRDSYLEFVD